MKIKRLAAATAGAGLVAALTGCFPDGVWKIGYGPGEVKPGVYATSVLPAAGCTTLLSTRTPDNLPDAIGGTVFAQGWAVFEVPRLLHGVVTSAHCGVWTSASPTTYNPNRTTAQVGTYRIPVDLEPGTYTAPAPKACVWFVHTSLSYVGSGSAGSLRVLGSTAAGHKATVTIRATDKAFITGDCGGWTRTGP
jgi:hypothetical protein